MESTSHPTLPLSKIRWTGQHHDNNMNKEYMLRITLKLNTKDKALSWIYIQVLKAARAVQRVLVTASNVLEHSRHMKAQRDPKP